MKCQIMFSGKTRNFNTQCLLDSPLLRNQKVTDGHVDALPEKNVSASDENFTQ